MEVSVVERGTILSVWTYHDGLEKREIAE